MQTARRSRPRRTHPPRLFMADGLSVRRVERRDARRAKVNMHVRLDTDTKPKISRLLNHARQQGVSFQCFSPDHLRSHRDDRRQTHPTSGIGKSNRPGSGNRIEERPMFFAKQADLAREQIGLGRFRDSKDIWRRDRDSNSGYLAVYTLSKRAPLSDSAISPRNQ